jgi:dolichol-phosphate mannosyltransferase
LQLSLVIPAYNEAATIRQAVQEAGAALAAAAAAYEIIVVDDGSTDATAAIVQAEAQTNPHVRLIRQPRNRGYGAALRSGFQAARFALVAFTDADCQFQLTDLAYMLPLTRYYAVICGYRIARKDPARRRFLSWGYNTLAQFLVGSSVRDVDCALKILRRENLADLMPQSDNFFANTEMLAKARLQGLAVVEVGVQHRPRAGGRSKVSWRDIPKVLATFLPFWWSKILFAGARPPTPKHDRGSWAGLAFVALVAGLLLFPHLSYPLVEPDEGRYAEIAREMAAEGDWLVPTLHGEPYYDKPPLLYWLVAASLDLFGVHAWAVRLVPASAAFLTVLATYLFGRRMAGARAGLLAALALALMAGFVHCGRFLVIDSLLTLWVGLGLFTGLEAVRGPRVRWGWWAVSALSCGLGVLTKGPVALVLLAPPLAAYAWLQRPGAWPRLTHWAAYAGLALAVAAPWFVAVTAYHPHFAYSFFVEHHLLRFFGESYHARPFWFYVPVLLVGCLPWSLLLWPLGRFLFARSAEDRARRHPALGFCLLWAGWCVLFFSLAHGKLPTYILPALPAVAILIGCFLERLLHTSLEPVPLRKTWAGLARLTAVLVATIWLTGNLWYWWTGRFAPTRTLLVGLEVVLCLACLVGLTCWGRRLSVRGGWALCGLLAFAFLLESSQGFIPAWAARRSPLARSADVVALLHDSRTGMAYVGMELGSVSFYLRGEGHWSNELMLPGEWWPTFCGRHSRNLLFTTDEVSEEPVRRLLPPGMAITGSLHSGQGMVYVVEYVPKRLVSK